MTASGEMECTDDADAADAADECAYVICFKGQSCYETQSGWDCKNVEYCEKDPFCTSGIERSDEDRERDAEALPGLMKELYPPHYLAWYGWYTDAHTDAKLLENVEFENVPFGIGATLDVVPSSGSKKLCSDNGDCFYYTPI